MTGNADPARTPDSRGVESAVSARTAFEGRALDRPSEDVEDQGLHFDIGTLVTRRRSLGVLGAGAAAAVLAACGAGTSSSEGSGTSDSGGTAASDGGTSASAEEMPTETAGPYPGDGSNGADVLETSGVQRSDITSSIDGGATAEGVAMTLTMNIIDLVEDSGPMTGAAVYLWHCDAQGGYSMYSDGITEETYLRGVQVVGEDGTVTFQTIVPGCYDGRWPHMHFEVFPNIDAITDAANAVLTSQIALPQDMAEAVYARSEYSGSAENMAATSLEGDNVFSDGADMQLPEVTGSLDAGYVATIDVPIDTSTEPEAAGMGGGAGPGGGVGEKPADGAEPPARGPGGTPPGGAAPSDGG